ncbi:hypothetical protein G9A89_011594 [Geosiphon pyriformis]|nr:hypothetical protein G9A89_011594 [Geosiphon pyriformis]
MTWKKINNKGKEKEKETLIDATAVHMMMTKSDIILELIDPKQFYEHYQELALTQEKQKQHCTLELESTFNPNSNSNNDDNKNNDSDLNSKQYIALPDFTKEQELKWFSNNDEGIMPEYAHNTNAGFDLKYLEKDAIKLEPHLCTCIDFKIALKIPTTTMVQLASRSSLAKKGINIKGRIIDAGYVGNIIAMLQNNSKKAYIIKPNEKLAQAIFLPLVKIT